MRPDLVLPLALVERRAIETALVLCLGCRPLAAYQLGISVSTLNRKLIEYHNADNEEPKLLSARAAGSV